MKSKDILDLMLYNSIPYTESDTGSGWYEYRIQLVECVIHIEAKIINEDYIDGWIPKYKVGRMWIE